MKIGMVCPYSWDVPGGVRSHIADLSETLIARGHDVQVLAPVEDPEDLPSWVVDGGRPIAVPYNGSVARLSFGVGAARRVRAWIREGDFDVVHVHEPLSPSLSVLTCWSASGPIVGTWHSSLDRSRVMRTGYYIAQTAAEKVRGHIAVSDDARRTLVSHVGGDAVLIPNGVRVRTFAEARPDPALKPFSVVFLGRIDEPRKGLAVLAEAWPLIRAKVPQARLVVVGPGEPEGDVLSNDTSVTWRGRVSDQEKAQILAGAHVYCAPHTGGESFGIVLAEAMAAGAAVAASDLPAFRRVLLDGECGEIFPVGDPSGLADSVITLLTDKTRHEDVTRAARNRVRDFDWDTVVDDVLAVYDSVRVPGEKVQEDLRGQIVGRGSAMVPTRLRKWRRTP